MTMITPDFSGKPTYAVTDAVTELLRVHARHLIATALEAEVTQVLADCTFRSFRTPNPEFSDSLRWGMFGSHQMPRLTPTSPPLW